jgi:hypothetical protein
MNLTTKKLSRTKTESAPQVFAADENLARTQLNLAMSSEQLERLMKHANKKHIPPSTLAKAWILERLDQEAKEA